MKDDELLDLTDVPLRAINCARCKTLFGVRVYDVSIVKLTHQRGGKHQLHRRTSGERVVLFYCGRDGSWRGPLENGWVLAIGQAVPA